MADKTVDSKGRERPFMGLNRHRFALAYGIILISSLLFLPALTAGMQSDVGLYRRVADEMVSGKLPYRDTVLEYPPYAIPIFILPRILGDEHYLIGFMLMAMLADWGVKMLLVLLAYDQESLVRFLLPVSLYCASVPFLSNFYLQRFDIYPTLLCLLALWLFSSGRLTLSGIALAAGIGVKLYPLLFVPPLFVLAVRQRKWKPFAIGLFSGLLPMALLSFYLPWWRFAEFHTGRGLQVESLYASIIWLLKLGGLTRATWVWPKSYAEVHGSMAQTLLPWSRLIFAGTVLLSTSLVTWVAMRKSFSQNQMSTTCPPIGGLKFDHGQSAMRTEGDSVALINSQATVATPEIARLLILPLLAFVAFNQVLSPQYLIWLLPLAVLASTDLERWVGPATALAALLTPIFYPTLHGDYLTGFDLMETSVLILRNCILAGLWAVLAARFLGRAFHACRK